VRRYRAFGPAPHHAAKLEANIIQDEDHRRLLQRSIEPDTRILSTIYHRANGIPFLIEVWKWEAITGSTAVFLTNSVAGMNDADLQNFLTEKAGMDLHGGVTISRRGTYTFLNFGFMAK
jgi:hypothetical protein